VEQQREDFEDRICTPIKNRLKPHHNTKNDQISRLLTRQILGFELPTFAGVVKEWPAFITTYNRTTKDCGF
jgi:hypothetical protein